MKPQQLIEHKKSINTKEYYSFVNILKRSMESVNEKLIRLEKLPFEEFSMEYEGGKRELLDSILMNLSENIYKSYKEVFHIDDLYFWHGYTNLSNKRLTISQSEKYNIRIFANNYVTGIGYCKEKYGYSLCPNSYWFNVLLNLNSQERKEFGFSPPTTNYWMKGQGKGDESFLLRLEADKSVFQVLSVQHVNDDYFKLKTNTNGNKEKLDKKDRNNGCITIKISNEQIIHAAQKVADQINKREYYCVLCDDKEKFNKYFIKYPLHYEDLFKQNENDKREELSENEIEELRKLQLNIYSIWYASVFFPDKINQSWIDDLKAEYPEKIKLFEHVERYLGEYPIFKGKHLDFEDHYFNNWYTLFIDNYSKENELGTFMIFTKNELPHWTLTIIFSYIKNAYAKIRGIESRVKMIQQATRSAVAAVMSRNMSHNFGSHSLVYLGKEEKLENSHFTKVPQLLITEVFNKKFLQYKDDGKEFQLIFNETINKIVLNDIRSLPKLLSIYNNNLRVRMDFIADIVTSVPSSVNSRWLFKDVLKKFIDNRILTDTISGVEDFTYELNTYNKEDIQVSIPNDIIGMDSFSIILENIIRNCAKHGVTNKIKLSIHIQDGNEIEIPEYYKITIHQNCNKEEKNGCPYCKTIRDRRLDINKPLLDTNTLNLRSGAWGILEMKIAAAYLRKIAPEETNSNEYILDIDDSGQWINDNINFRNDKIASDKTPYILTADCCVDKNCSTDNGLGYSFFLMKPKEVLLFDYDNKLKEINLNKQVDLLNHGIKIIRGEEEIINSFKTTIFNHRILICLSAESKKSEREKQFKEDNDYTPHLPYRIIWLDHNNLIDKSDKCIDNDECLLNCLINGLPDCFIMKSWQLWTYKIIEMLKQREKCDYFDLHGKQFPEAIIGSAYKISIPGTPHSLNFHEEFKNYSYFDIDTSYSVSKLPFGGFEEIKKIFNYSKNPQYKFEDRYCYEMVSFFESTISRIGVIDERIQEFAFNSNYKDIKSKSDVPYYKYFRKMKIYIPSKSQSSESSHDNKGINLSSSIYGDKIKRDILNWIGKLCPKLDYLLIHMGIIEKLCGNTDKGELGKYFQKNILDKVGECKIIIISGRGKPHNIPSCTRFLNYSQLAAYTCDNQSKYMLHDLCNSARSIK